MGDLVEEYAQRRAEEAERRAEEAQAQRMAQVVRYLAEREGITVGQACERMGALRGGVGQAPGAVVV